MFLGTPTPVASNWQMILSPFVAEILFADCHSDHSRTTDALSREAAPADVVRSWKPRAEGSPRPRLASHSGTRQCAVRSAPTTTLPA